MKKITYSAPGKVIFSGEHSVVWGKPALVASINLRVKVSVYESKKNNDSQLGTVISKIVKEFLDKEKIKFKDKNFNFEIDSELPIGRGLGASGALGVSGAASFLEFYTGRIFEKEMINNVAYIVEKYFHKNPSGVDPSTSCFGGLIFYRKEFEFLKYISSLNLKIPEKIEKNLYLIDTGKPKETTAVMVESVGKLINKNSAKMDQTLTNIEKTTKRIVVSFFKEDVAFFRDSLKENERLLEEIDIVSDKTKKIIEKLSHFGTAKVTGGGGKKDGSGYLLFFSEDAEKLKNFCKSNSLEYFKFKQSNEGVKKEK